MIYINKTCNKYYIIIEIFNKFIIIIIIIIIITIIIVVFIIVVFIINGVIALSLSSSLLLLLFLRKFLYKLIHCLSKNNEHVLSELTYNICYC